MSKNILVTGGLGAVGTPLVRELRGRGHQVFVADLPHHDDASYARCDVGEYRQVERLWTGGGWEPGYAPAGRSFDIVYHLAAEFGRWNGEDYYEKVWRSNAIGTKNIIRMQEKEGFEAVYFSSSEVYGDFDGVMAEDVMDKHEVRQMNDYALSKWVNEQQIMNSAVQFDTKSVRVRLFNTYGPGEPYSPYRSVICLFCYRALHDIPFTVYRGYKRTSTYIDDMARTLANITDRFNPGEVYNIGGTDYHTIEDAADIILRLTGKRAEDLVTYKDGEILTTRQKLVDSSKAAARPGSPHHRDARGRNWPHAGLDASAVRRLTMASPHILTVFGTRPRGGQWPPCCRPWHADVVSTVCCTGQHDTLVQQAMRSFGITPDIDLQVMRAGQSLAPADRPPLPGVRHRADRHQAGPGSRAWRHDLGHGGRHVRLLPPDPHRARRGRLAHRRPATAFPRGDEPRRRGPGSGPSLRADRHAAENLRREGARDGDRARHGQHRGGRGQLDRSAHRERRER